NNKLNLNYNPNERYIDVRSYNVWIKTVDKEVPDKANIYGEISYKVDDAGNRIPTNGCYIQLYFITATPTRHVLFTSSGVHTIGITKWDMTAAIRENYRQESQPKMNRGERYEKNLTKLLNRRKPLASHLRAVQSMLNPISEVWLDLEGSMRNAFPQYRKEDRMKIITTQAFREALMNVLSALFPGLKSQIRNDIPPLEITKFMKTMMEQVLDKDVKVDDKLKVLDYIMENGYKENPIEQSLHTFKLAEHRPPQLEGAKDEPKKEESEFPIDDIMADEEFELTDEEKQTKEDLGYPSGYAERESEPSLLEEVILKSEEK